MANISFDTAELLALAAALKPYLGSSEPATPPVVAPPVVTPPVTADPALARFLSAPSDWARWTSDDWLGSKGGGYTSKDFAPIVAHLVAKYGWDVASTQVRVNQQLNAYNSTIKLGGTFDPAKHAYAFTKFILGIPYSVADTGGAADAYIASKFPGVVAGPLV